MAKLDRDTRNCRENEGSSCRQGVVIKQDGGCAYCSMPGVNEARRILFDALSGADNGRVYEKAVVSPPLEPLIVCEARDCIGYRSDQQCGRQTVTVQDGRCSDYTPDSAEKQEQIAIGRVERIRDWNARDISRLV